MGLGKSGPRIVLPMLLPPKPGHLSQTFLGKTKRLFTAMMKNARFCRRKTWRAVLGATKIVPVRNFLDVIFARVIWGPVGIKGCETLIPPVSRRPGNNHKLGSAGEPVFNPGKAAKTAPFYPVWKCRALGRGTRSGIFSLFIICLHIVHGEHGH